VSCQAAANASSASLRRRGEASRSPARRRADAIPGTNPSSYRSRRADPPHEPRARTAQDAVSPCGLKRWDKLEDLSTPDDQVFSNNDVGVAPQPGGVPCAPQRAHGRGLNSACMLQPRNRNTQSPPCPRHLGHARHRLAPGEARHALTRFGVTPGGDLPPNTADTATQADKGWNKAYRNHHNPVQIEHPQVFRRVLEPSRRRLPP
jgi:hypothetical protein